MIKSIFTVIPEDLHFRVKHKCRYYHLTMQEVLAVLLEKFDEGTFDYIFNLPSKD